MTLMIGVIRFLFRLVNRLLITAFWAGVAFFLLSAAVTSFAHASTISYDTSTQTLSGTGLFGNSNATDIYTWMSATGTNVLAGGTFANGGSGTWSKTITDLGANSLTSGAYVLYIFNHNQWFGACGSGKTLDDCIAGIGGQGVNDTQNYIAVPVNVSGGGTNTTTTINTTTTASSTQLEDIAERQLWSVTFGFAFLCGIILFIGLIHFFRNNNPGKTTS